MSKKLIALTFAIALVSSLFSSPAYALRNPVIKALSVVIDGVRLIDSDFMRSIHWRTQLMDEIGNLQLKLAELENERYLFFELETVDSRKLEDIDSDIDRVQKEIQDRMIELK